MSQPQYDEDYFLRGRETGKSLYQDFRWMPALTIPFARRIAGHLGMADGDKILDYGCARGYMVKALRILGYDARGVDISEWAIENCDPDVKSFVRLGGISPDFGHPCAKDWVCFQPDWILFKDVLEHIEEPQLHPVLRQAAVAAKGFFVIVPLGDMGTYIVPEFNADVTHRIRWPLGEWVKKISNYLSPDHSITAQYRIPGMKDNYAQWPTGNGFITVRKVN